MADYVELGDVRTWYDEHGDGEPLALLHPGGADARAWGPNSTRSPRISASSRPSAAATGAPRMSRA